MGTSMGTITALSPIGAGLATSLGPVEMARIVVGGAMFGDNLSFVSDTTIAATRTQRSVKDVQGKQWLQSRHASSPRAAGRS